MTKNVGGIDRVIRIVVGIILLLLVSLVFVGPQTPWAYLGLIGLGPIITGTIGYCPPYTLFGINTCKKISKEG
ncbi:MAG: DUF2892 domain-containing protein [Deltaproteobacteria bacterium]|nr:MAG: DUF2892 domain-containing protein [Deltaproteobacteria bacterium]